MKKMFILASLVATPALAACLITGGACNTWDPASPMENKYVPSYMQDFYKPSYMEHLMHPEQYMPAPIYVEPSTPSGPTGGAVNLDRSTYDANCQFGICLPSGH